MATWMTLLSWLGKLFPIACASSVGNGILALGGLSTSVSGWRHSGTIGSVCHILQQLLSGARWCWSAGCQPCGDAMFTSASLHFWWRGTHLDRGTGRERCTNGHPPSLWRDSPRESATFQGLEGGRWKIRAGNYITLGGLFKFGGRQATCYHLYKMHLALGFYTHRLMMHPRYPHAVYNQNAKVLRHHQETGKWGLLPWHHRQWSSKKKR